MTDPTAYAPVLQYGALGLLAIFIVGFLWIQRDRDKRSDERLDSAAESRAKTEGAMWELVNATITARTSETKAFAELAARTTAVQEDVIDVLKALERQVTENERRAVERHAQIVAELKAKSS